MLRAIALSLFLLIGLGVVIPFVSNYAEAGAHKHKHHKKKHRKYKKYSKNWWRMYHRKQRQNQALVARRRTLRLRQIRLANAVKATANASENQAKITKVSGKSTVADSTVPAILPSGNPAPKGWKRGAVSPDELQFRVDDDNGSNIGSASISVVGPALGADGDSSARGGKTVGGVQTSSLRRTVIDQMIKEEGWVVNDYQKEIGGRRVFVVVAQSPGAVGGKVQSRLFYFTEVDGRIYSVATSAPNGSSQRIEQESERVITSLQRAKSNAVQQAELK